MAALVKRKEGALNGSCNRSGGYVDKRQGGMGCNCGCCWDSCLAGRHCQGGPGCAAVQCSIDVQCSTLFFQCCALGTAGGKNEQEKHTTSNLDL